MTFVSGTTRVVKLILPTRSVVLVIAFLYFHCTAMSQMADRSELEGRYICALKIVVSVHEAREAVSQYRSLGLQSSYLWMPEFGSKMDDGRCLHSDGLPIPNQLEDITEDSEAFRLKNTQTDASGIRRTKRGGEWLVLGGPFVNAVDAMRYRARVISASDNQNPLVRIVGLRKKTLRTRDSEDLKVAYDSANGELARLCATMVNALNDKDRVAMYDEYQSWGVYRARECDAAASPYEGNPKHDMVLFQCLLDRTRSRIDYLTELLKSEIHTRQAPQNVSSNEDHQITRETGSEAQSPLPTAPAKTLVKPLKKSLYFKLDSKGARKP